MILREIFVGIVITLRNIWGFNVWGNSNFLCSNLFHPNRFLYFLYYNNLGKWNREIRISIQKMTEWGNRQANRKRENINIKATVWTFGNTKEKIACAVFITLVKIKKTKKQIRFGLGSSFDNNLMEEIVNMTRIVFPKREGEASPRRRKGLQYRIHGGTFSFHDWLTTRMRSAITTTATDTGSADLAWLHERVFWLGIFLENLSKNIFERGVSPRGWKLSPRKSCVTNGQDVFVFSERFLFSCFWCVVNKSVWFSKQHCLSRYACSSMALEDLLAF